MFEPLIKFPADSTVAGQREVLARRISSLERDRADHQTEIDRIEKIARSWEGKLAAAQRRGHSMDEDIKKGTEQLLRLLPGVQSDNLLPGLYTYQGTDVRGHITFRKEEEANG